MIKRRCLLSFSPFKLGKSEALTISDQAFSLSHSEQGFGNGLSRATPPVKRNRQTWSSTLFLEIQKNQF